MNTYCITCKFLVSWDICMACKKSDKPINNPETTFCSNYEVNNDRNKNIPKT